ncbi:MAG: thermonuclease family protein [Nitriliruptoraceae bacterium]
MLLVGCGTGGWPAELPGPSETIEGASERPAGVPRDAEPARVDRVVDGDTVRLFAGPGSGLGDRGSVRVRLLNIDAPELPRDGRPGECLAEEAAQRLGDLLADSQVVWIAADREDRDAYDRPLRALWTDDGVFVTEVLAAEGLAVAVLFRPNDRFHAPIVAAERHAAAAGNGLHGPACR